MNSYSTAIDPPECFAPDIDEQIEIRQMRLLMDAKRSQSVMDDLMDATIGGECSDAAELMQKAIRHLLEGYSHSGSGRDALLRVTGMLLLEAVRAGAEHVARQQVDYIIEHGDEE